jgi:hypothetical protein
MKYNNMLIKTIDAYTILSNGDEAYLLTLDFFLFFLSEDLKIIY